MNTKIGTVILIIACVGLAVALLVVRQQARDQQTRAAEVNLNLSNQLVDAHDEINGLNQVNLVLTNALNASQQQSATLSNTLTETADTLTSTATSLQTAQQQITNLNDRITDLEAQNRTLDQRAQDLTNTIAAMDEQIALTQKKLAESDTNNAFLADELKRQVAEKAELEHKFNDLQVVRAQVRKLRDDLLIARRLEWMRMGTDPSQQKKGGELLMQRPPATATATSGPPSSLNVEVGSDGAVRVIPPPTNSPTH